MFRFKVVAQPFHTILNTPFRRRKKKRIIYCIAETVGPYGKCRIVSLLLISEPRFVTVGVFLRGQAERAVLRLEKRSVVTHKRDRFIGVKTTIRTDYSLNWKQKHNKKVDPEQHVNLDVWAVWASGLSASGGLWFVKGRSD